MAGQRGRTKKKSPDNEGIQTINIMEEEWSVGDLPITPREKATLEIARWVLFIFAGVFAVSFVLAFYMIIQPGASYDKSVELIKFFVGSVVPLATLAVGYYLGTASQDKD